MSAWVWWVSLWDRREHPRALALVRIALALVILSDLLWMLRLGVVVDLFGPLEAGAVGNPLGRGTPPLLYRVLPATAAGAGGAFAAAVLACLGLLFGLAPRVCAVLLCLLLAQFALVLPPADRGIDMLLRNVLLILAVSGAGEWGSLRAWRRTGSLWGKSADRVPAWPRYLLVAQLVLLYGAAGASKVASSWLPGGDLSALYVAMLDPAFQRVPAPLLEQAFPLTQVATLATWLWEWSAPLLLLALHYRSTRERGGRLRALFNRLPFVGGYLAVGAFFHLGTHFTLQLGIFPFAVLALYPAVLHPDEVAVLGRRLRSWVLRRGQSASPCGTLRAPPGPGA